MDRSVNNGGRLSAAGELISLRAIAHERFGDPAEVLFLASVSTLGEPAEGEVLIRVGVRPVHPGDLQGVDEPGSGKIRGLRIPGLEGMGTVVETGTGVTGLATGTRVAFFPAQGAFGEFVIAPAEFVVALPDSVPDDVGALLMVNPLTSLELMRATEAAWAGTPRPYLQTAAGSSVAALVSASAVRHGYPLVNLVRSAEGAEALARRFPSIPVFSSSEPDWKQKVQEALGGGASVVLDPIGAEGVADLLELLEDGGTLVSYGALAGPVLHVMAMSLIQRHLRLQGVSIGTWIARPAEQRRADATFAVELATERPELFPVAGRYELGDFRTAVEHVRRPGKVGTVLVTEGRDTEEAGL